MKFRACPFKMFNDYVLETVHDETGDIRYFIGTWNGFALETDENEEGLDYLCDRQVTGYICLTREDAE